MSRIRLNLSLVNQSFCFRFSFLKALVLLFITSVPLCQFCTGALQHSASEVRETVVLIILAMYRLHKTAILSYLPANYAATRKNVLYKNIFDGFARIDGRPVESQARLGPSVCLNES